LHLADDPDSQELELEKARPPSPGRAFNFSSGSLRRHLLRRGERQHTRGRRESPVANLNPRQPPSLHQSHDSGPVDIQHSRRVFDGQQNLISSFCFKVKASDAGTPVAVPERQFEVCAIETPL
jgi:hypothetical protein